MQSSGVLGLDLSGFATHQDLAQRGTSENLWAVDKRRPIVTNLLAEEAI
jgi:hypothetical protein